ncbi:MAG: methyltransferase domain-containing protein [Myxococcota bacterium]
MTSFVDRYADMSAAYAKFRPRYPLALFDAVAGWCERHDGCWDCGTGSGQAATALARHFERVVATDASEQQLAHAEAHPRVEYRCESAAECSLPDGSVDLVTAASSVHWMDLARFYAEVRRVLRPGGVVALWTYGVVPQVSPEVDEVLHTYANAVLGPYQPPELAVVHSGYRELWFPFDELSCPPFAIDTHWTLADLVGAIETWSAAGRYRRERGTPPSLEVLEPLRAAWGDPERRRPVHLPLHLRIGRR